jgi:small-conductance mechanosensitive channel
MLATWFQFWLYFHVLAVIVAFGPTFTFGPIANMARKDPAHAAAYARVTHWIEKNMVLPMAALVPLLGVALIITGRFDLWKSEWLVISIILFIIAYFFALFVQLPNSTRMADALAAMPAPPAGAPAGPPPGGPPAEIEALGKKLQMGGIFLTVMVVVILVLMVWRPGNQYLGIL